MGFDLLVPDNYLSFYFKTIGHIAMFSFIVPREATSVDRLMEKLKFFFLSVSTVFQSYQTDSKVIIKGMLLLKGPMQRCVV